MRTRQPGGTEIGCKLRALLLDPAYAPDIDKTTQALLYAADRRIHLRHIRQALAEGKIVLSDRYVYSNLAYQLAGGSDRGTLAQLDKLATEGLRPHQAFWLDLNPAAARDRLAHDSRPEPDRYDAELDFQYKLHEVYLEQLQTCPELMRVDADRPAGEIVNDIYGQILTLI
jgi:dTMP kinase